VEKTEAVGAPVLVVEDDDELRDVVLVMLELHGYRAVAAANGDEAMALLRAGLRPCVIVFDLIMPGRNGWEFRAELLADPALASIPTIAVSGAVQGESVRSALRVTAFLSKPLDLDKLVASLGEHCRNGQTDPPA